MDPKQTYSRVLKNRHHKTDILRSNILLRIAKNGHFNPLHAKYHRGQAGEVSSELHTTCSMFKVEPKSTPCTKYADSNIYFSNLTHGDYEHGDYLKWLCKKVPIESRIIQIKKWELNLSAPSTGRKSISPALPTLLLLQKSFMQSSKQHASWEKEGLEVFQPPANGHKTGGRMGEGGTGEGAK